MNDLYKTYEIIFYICSILTYINAFTSKNTYGSGKSDITSLSRTEIISKLDYLNTTYHGKYIKITTAQDRYSISSNKSCEDRLRKALISFDSNTYESEDYYIQDFYNEYSNSTNKESLYDMYKKYLCDDVIIMLSDFDSIDLNRKQVFISNYELESNFMNYKDSIDSNSLSLTLLMNFISESISLISNEAADYLNSNIKCEENRDNYNNSTILYNDKILINTLSDTLSNLLIVIIPDFNYKLNTMSSDQIIEDLFITNNTDISTDTDDAYNCLTYSFSQSLLHLLMEFNFIQSIFVSYSNKTEINVIKNNALEDFISKSLEKQLLYNIKQFNNTYNQENIKTLLRTVEYDALLNLFSYTSKSNTKDTCINKYLKSYDNKNNNKELSFIYSNLKSFSYRIKISNYNNTDKYNLELGINSLLSFIDLTIPKLNIVNNAKYDILNNNKLSFSISGSQYAFKTQVYRIIPELSFTEFTQAQIFDVLSSINKYDSYFLKDINLIKTMSNLNSVWENSSRSSDKCIDISKRKGIYSINSVYQLPDKVKNKFLLDRNKFISNIHNISDYDINVNSSDNTNEASVKESKETGNFYYNDKLFKYLDDSNIIFIKSYVDNQRISGDQVIIGDYEQNSDNTDIHFNTTTNSPIESYFEVPSFKKYFIETHSHMTNTKLIPSLKLEYNNYVVEGDNKIYSHPVLITNNGNAYNNTNIVVLDNLNSILYTGNELSFYSSYSNNDLFSSDLKFYTYTFVCSKVNRDYTNINYKSFDSINSDNSATSLSFTSNWLLYRKLDLCNLNFNDKKKYLAFKQRVEQGDYLSKSNNITIDWVISQLKAYSLLNSNIVSIDSAVTIDFQYYTDLKNNYVCRSNNLVDIVDDLYNSDISLLIKVFKSFSIRNLVYCEDSNIFSTKSIEENNNIIQYSYDFIRNHIIDNKITFTITTKGTLYDLKESIISNPYINNSYLKGKLLDNNSAICFIIEEENKFNKDFYFIFEKITNFYWNISIISTLKTVPTNIKSSYKIKKIELLLSNSASDKISFTLNSNEKFHSKTVYIQDTNIVGKQFKVVIYYNDINDDKIGNESTIDNYCIIKQFNINRITDKEIIEEMNSTHQDEKIKYIIIGVSSLLVLIIAIILVMFAYYKHCRQDKMFLQINTTNAYDNIQQSNSIINTNKNLNIIKNKSYDSSIYGNNTNIIHYNNNVSHSNNNNSLSIGVDSSATNSNNNNSYINNQSISNNKDTGYNGYSEYDDKHKNRNKY